MRVNQLDALVLVLLIPFAVRGWWRGFCREACAVVGLVGGALLAASRGADLAALLVARASVPPEIALLLGWGALFLAAVLVAALAGRILERLARALFLGGLNRVGGVVLGSVKGIAVLAVALLVIEQAAPPVRPALAASRVARPLTQLAADLLSHVWHDEPPPHQEQV